MSEPTPPYPQGGQPQQPWQPSPHGQTPPPGGYGAPAPQPAYTEQPPYGQQPFQPAAPPKSKKGLWIGLGAAAAVLLLLCCVGVVVFLVKSDDGEPTVRSLPSTSSKTSTTPGKKVKVTLVAPDKLGDRDKITDSQHQKFADATEAAMKVDDNVESVVVAYYGTVDPAKDKVYLAGATTGRPLSKSMFDRTFDFIAVGAGAGEMTQVADVEPGPLGGFARCGRLEIQSMPVAACAWSDEGSFAAVMWYNREITSERKAELITIRSQVETKA